MYSTDCPCLSDADWRLQPDALRPPKITSSGTGFTFLNIPPSYYGRLVIETLTEKVFIFLTWAWF